jgi:hypothetical protein
VSYQLGVGTRLRPEESIAIGSLSLAPACASGGVGILVLWGDDVGESNISTMGMARP